jgi:putative aldouronate transport system permease protein
MGIPESLEESAWIDGANDIVILFKIILPLSMPIIATVILWQAVGHWNAWFDSLIYIQNQKKQVLQIILRRIILAGSQDAFASTGLDVNVTKPESLKAATIMVVIFPIICVYPFVQKYFVKGVMVGSLKG